MDNSDILDGLKNYDKATNESHDQTHTYSHTDSQVQPYTHRHNSFENPDISTPGKAVKAYCRECAGSSHMTSDCGGNRPLCPKDKPCSLYDYRRKGNGKPKLSNIRKFCIQCMGGNYKLVRDCPAIHCYFYMFRMGRGLRYGLGRTND